MSGNRNKLIAFNYFGGKFTWLEYLYTNFPRDFTHLVDLFAGSMAVSLNYPGRIIKTANEINGDITNFFEVLRDHEPELTRLLLLTPCSELEYNNSWEPSDDKHRELSDRLHSIKGKAMISSYDCPLMRELYGDWNMIKFPVKKNNIRSSEVQEVIWINYDLEKTLF